ncbi:hypothetical protein [Micromonospora sp. 4G55]|uniref:hypothetical protein n=1 Tax=Micromonospora sp. 4G55 TaxID=2806102 RepID=UPI001A387388|nr:hypothetical protein [Micromonospora sp. 4G55]MBM0255480.1 hypothetical protein [Micromonospora sp. 4G55]
MRPEMMIAVTSAGVSLVSALLSSRATYRAAVLQHRLQEQAHRRSKAELAEELFRRYREPLLWAAHSLQSRLFNAISRNFLTTYLHGGDPEEERYVRDNTVYVLAEYLAWLEIIRRDQRFLDIGDVEGTKEFFARIGRTRDILGTDSVEGPFRLFRGQQRAIGELVLTPGESSNGAGQEVMGYATFCERLDNDARFAAWFDRLRFEVDAIEQGGIDGNQRLVQLQNRLIDLVESLDPNGDRLPRSDRDRLVEHGHLPTQRALADTD